MISPLSTTNGTVVVDRYGNKNRIMLPHHQSQVNSYYGSGGHQQQQQQQRHNQQQQQHVSLSRHQHPNYMIGCFSPNPNGWAGVPLISTATRRPRKNYAFNNNNNNSGIKQQQQQQQQQILVPNSTEYDGNTISQLAIHAHGVPLILTRGYRNRNQKINIAQKQGGNTSSVIMSHAKGKFEGNVVVAGSENVKNMTYSAIDTTISPIIDENGTNNHSTSEACLPRIIKPRKRRKKDRKPQSVCLPNSNMIVTTSPQLSDSNQHSPVECCDHRATNLCATLSFLETNTNYNNNVNNISTETIIQSPPALMSSPTHLQTNNVNLLQLQQLDDDNSNASACYCRLCDPSNRIWAFPLRRSCSDNSAEIEMHRSNKDVGVIGSNRSWSTKTEWRSSLQMDSQDNFLSRNSSFSDSGDSGCEILSGINFVQDVFNNNSCLINSNKNTEFSVINSNSSQCMTNNIDRTSVSQFPTAESLLTESINEISKKLMETVDLRSDVFSSDTSSVFSDSVISDDVLINLESLTKSAATFFCAGDINNIFDTSKHQSNIINNNESFDIDDTTTKNNKQSLFQSDNNNFMMFHEKDCENEVLNCFDMVWNGSKLLPIGRENSAAV